LHLIKNEDRKKKFKGQKVITNTAKQTHCYFNLQRQDSSNVMPKKVLMAISSNYSTTKKVCVVLAETTRGHPRSHHGTTI
jgi:hypothetical protein